MKNAITAVVMTAIIIMVGCSISENKTENELSDSVKKELLKQHNDSLKDSVIEEIAIKESIKNDSVK